MSNHEHHAHGHAHHSHHGHAHAAVDPTQRAFSVGITLNLVFVAVELYFGFSANSLALLADAGHNFSDVIGLLIAWGALTLAKRKPSARFTYGLRSSTIMAAAVNAMILLVAVGGIVWEGAHRLSAPEAVSGDTIIWVALLGMFINIGTALMLQQGSKHDINVRGAFLHMVADAAVSLGVVVAGLAMLWLGWLWLDGAVSILIAVVILWSTWDLFRESINLSLHAVPAHVDARKVRDYLSGLSGVTEVHDLHIWAMSTTEIALTVHLLLPAGHPGDAFLHDASDQLGKRFHIHHSTLQIEIGSDTASCRLAPEDVV
ncbi:MAG TPA: cation diffusion facilitator family transporter [Gallionellaceae bacterium]|nr:cation diffusion facilitator family transporter [Gallionellaceae bacterium]